MKDYKEFFKNKKITVMGLGLLGGVRDICFLAEMGASLIVTDLKNKEDLRSSLDVLKKFKNIRYTLGGHNLKDFQNRDLIIKAPTTPLDSIYIKEAHENKISVTMWAALFSEFARDLGATIIGVTGTRGKTTATAMIVEVLMAAQKKVIFGGNIQGTAILSNLPKLTSETIVVLELDSWKLQGFDELKISPNISVFTTFFPDHLNYYDGDIKKYFLDKSNIFKYQKKNDLLIVGSQVVPFIKKYSSAPEGKVIIPKAKLPSGWRLKVLGEHNVYDAMLVVEVARALGLKDLIIKKALGAFKGVEGRLQFVKKVRGVKYYNDTTATTPEATIAALRALRKNKNIILIAGGSDKGLDMNTLIKEISKYCRNVILLSGTGTNQIKNKIRGAIEVDSLKNAISEAQKLSKKSGVILLSPAFASFGMFKNEYDRGDQFLSILKELE